MMIKERLGKVYVRICLLTTVYVSLGVPQMIYYTATHSVVCDGKYTATQGVVRDEIQESHEGRPPKCDS